MQHESFLEMNLFGIRPKQIEQHYRKHMAAASLIQIVCCVVVVARGVVVGNNLDRSAAECGLERKAWLRYRRTLAMNKWLFSRYVRVCVARLGRDPKMRFVGTIDNARQDETPEQVRVDDAHTKRRRIRQASNDHACTDIVSASTSANAVSDVSTLKVLQTHQSYEYVFAYPNDAEHDDDMKIVIIGGPIFDTLQNLRSTSAADIAEAMRRCSSVCLDDSQSEYCVRSVCYDGLLPHHQSSENAT